LPRICPEIERFIDAEVALRPPLTSSNLRSGQHFAYRTGKRQIAEIAITLIALQSAAFTLTAAYLVFSAVMLHRRNQLSWDSLSSRLHPAWASTRYAAPFGAIAADRSALWSAFRDAGVLMQMADYADRNGVAVDRSVVASMRADAIRIRFAVLQSFLRQPRVH
jgi:hypothetical protein